MQIWLSLHEVPAPTLMQSLSTLHGRHAPSEPHKWLPHSELVAHATHLLPTQRLLLQSLFNAQPIAISQLPLLPSICETKSKSFGPNLNMPKWLPCVVDRRFI